MSTTTLRPAAFFDLDHTLIRCSSGTRWMAFMHRRGEVGLGMLLKTTMWSLKYKLAILDMETVGRRLVAAMAGDSEAEMLEKATLFTNQELLPEVAPLGREALVWHSEREHPLVMLTSSTQYVAEPMARALGIEHVLCSRLLVDNGRFLGTVETPLCYGAGKVLYAERFAERHGIDLARSYFYTDSYSDLPMLLRIGEPRIVNPDRRLQSHAQKKGWPIARW
jgi:HAD superfamily hydrolase (TIGR01490 family)